MRIPIPEDCEKINVLLSGGADSALLLFLLMKERKLTSRNIPIKCYVMDSPNEAHKDVLKWVSQYFKEEIPFQRTTKFFIREIVNNILLADPGYVYSGCNLVLEHAFIPTVFIPGDTPPVRGPAFNEMHKRPFINLAKDVLTAEYQRQNIIDLFKLTISCGISNIPCGGCYFCMERQWGIDKSGIVL